MSALGIRSGHAARLNNVRFGPDLGMVNRLRAAAALRRSLAREIAAG
jgi:hypothetical protein